MLLALHTISGALRMLSPGPPEEEAAPETESDRPEAEQSRGIIDWADDESEAVNIHRLAPFLMATLWLADVKYVLSHWMILNLLLSDRLLFITCYSICPIF